MSASAERSISDAGERMVAVRIRCNKSAMVTSVEGFDSIYMIGTDRTASESEWVSGDTEEDLYYQVRELGESWERERGDETNNVRI